VDLVFQKRGLTPKPCDTESTPLSGAHFERFRDLVARVAAAPEVRGDLKLAESLAHNHGSRYEDVLKIARERTEWAAPIDGSATLAVEVIHAIRAEMALTLGRRAAANGPGHAGRPRRRGARDLREARGRRTGGRTKSKGRTEAVRRWFGMRRSRFAP
jgi:hypothetical protein